LLEIERHQRLQSLGLGGRKAVEGLFDGASKVGEGRILSAVEGATFDELPHWPRNNNRWPISTEPER